MEANKFSMSRWKVEGVAPGDVLGLEEGHLVVGPLPLTRSPLFERIDIDIIEPNTPVRLTHVLDCVIPSVKPAVPAAAFPGILGPPVPAGHGPTNFLDGIVVSSAADLNAFDFETPMSEIDSILDMGGPGAALSPLADKHHILMTFLPRKGSDPRDIDAAIRQRTFWMARHLAEVTIGRSDATHTEVPGQNPSPDERLPRIALVVQVASEGLFADTYLYGQPMQGLGARSIRPEELLDGALTNASYDYAGLRNTTSGYQDNALVRAMMSRHNVDLDFAGVVTTPAYLETQEEKEAAARQAAALVVSLQPGGLVITSFQSGNSHTDTMLLVQECERRGVRTVAIMAENDGGLVDHVPEATALVSSGNEDELVPAWVPTRVYGPGTFHDGVPASTRRPLPTVAYLASVEQMGNNQLRVVAA